MRHRGSRQGSRSRQSAGMNRMVVVPSQPIKVCPYPALGIEAAMAGVVRPPIGTDQRQETTWALHCPTAADRLICGRGNDGAFPPPVVS